MTSQRSLITFFFLLFIGSALFMFWRNDQELDPNQGKSWWTLSFADPQNVQDLTFTVENYSDQELFHYEIVSNKHSLVQESLIVKRGERTTITPSVNPTANQRTTIIVTAGKEKEEIYR